MKLERSIEIARERDAVWAVLGDPSLMPEWFPKLANFASTDGDGSAAGDSYTIDYVRESGPIELSVTVLEVDPPNGHVHRFEGLPVAFTISSALSGGDGQTTWTGTVEVKLSLVQRALGPVIKGYLDDLVGDLAGGFKSYVEAQ